MKKLYIEPELELVNIFLISDVLAASKEDDVIVDGDDFDEGNFGDGDFIVIP